MSVDVGCTVPAREPTCTAEAAEVLGGEVA